MPSNPNTPARGREARSPATPRSPFPRFERISERLADEPPAPDEEPRDRRELEIPRTESFGELWRRAQARRLGR
jgi:hypothetical protein